MVAVVITASKQSLFSGCALGLGQLTAVITTAPCVNYYLNKVMGRATQNFFEYEDIVEIVQGIHYCLPACYPPPLDLYSFPCRPSSISTAS